MTGSQVCADRCLARIERIYFFVDSKCTYCVDLAPVYYKGVDLAPVYYKGVGLAPVYYKGVDLAPVYYKGVGLAPVYISQAKTNVAVIPDCLIQIYIKT